MTAPAPLPPPCLRVRGAAEHNLRRVDVDIPHDRLTVVTGVSGSGKSSLAFDVIFQEARRRYLESFSTQSRSWMGRLERPDVERIDGLRPAIAVGLRRSAGSPRSTVGTLTEIYDWLRLLFARLGEGPSGLSLDRSLFSFNSPRGACPACRGLGVEDRIDPELLVADPQKTLRQGALALTTPNGYIIYSQVTLDVLDQVCRAHGFHVDIPWKDLSTEARRVVMEGSDRIRIPYGKHPLESRLRWTGITPKPREEGTYKGILPVMEAILKAKRNDNILRFARTLACRSCQGDRLNPQARSVLFRGRSIASYGRETLSRIDGIFRGLEFSAREAPPGEEIRRAVLARTEILLRLGLGHLSADRESATLSGGETQRIRLAAQAGNGLRGMLYVFDEPTAGLHPAEAGRLLEVLRELRDNGNTILIVEHDETAIRTADHLIDLGPGPGKEGGRLLWSGPPAGLLDLPPGVSPTRDHLNRNRLAHEPRERRAGSGTIAVLGARLHNLRGIRAEFKLGAFNVVTGVSGAGKTTLVKGILAARLAARRFGGGDDADAVVLSGRIKTVIEIDQDPIGRTPRSNPATYTGISDRIRDLFASLPEARARGWGKGRFSFNTPGGRCEHCQGAGRMQIGMHFLGDVDVPCPVCEGRRFKDEILEVRCGGRDIRQILDFSFDEAAAFFSGQPRLLRSIEILRSLGLGYMKLGQSSTTLSGGEAQRVKLASELMRSAAEDTVVLLEEPTSGLHGNDVETLLAALHKMVDQGQTVIAVEHHPDFIRAADWVVDLGPGSGEFGGRVVAEGTPEEIAAAPDSLTGRALRGERFDIVPDRGPQIVASRAPAGPIRLRGVTTHNLRSVDVDFPFQRLTVVSGPSGGGKSSLVFDTLYAESRRRFLDGFSTYIRSRLDKAERADFDSAWGLTPPLAVGPRLGGSHPRSTVGTMTEIYDYYRLLYSRAGSRASGKPLAASHFSFNHEEGACPRCRGLGRLTVCDPDALITDPAKPLTAGAMDGTKTGRFYGDPHGQHAAALQAAGAESGVDFSAPFSALSAAARNLALFGSGDRLYDVVWSYRRGARAGDFRFRGPWKGFAGLIEAEYERKHADRRGEAMLSLMAKKKCPACRGGRLNAETLAVTLLGRDIAALSALSIRESLSVFAADEAFRELDPQERAAALALRPEIHRRLELVRDVGLDYLTLDRGSEAISAGETQRLRLASLQGARLTGVTFILDEPTLGLHPRDTERLIGLLRGLVRQRNTVVAVEHDLGVVAAADHVIDLGPGAGPEGGRIVAQGTPEEIRSQSDSPTGRALKAPFILSAPSAAPFETGVAIDGARAHNLQSIDAVFPRGVLTTVSGVSGSGKTSLVLDVLHRSIQAGRAVDCRSIRGTERFVRTVLVDQDPLTAGASSTPLTYAGLFDGVRGLFAATDEARKRGFGKAHFSFLTPEGRCPVCRGSGVNRISLDFVADIESSCEECRGRRYRSDVLEVRWRGRTIAETLALTASEGVSFFADQISLSGSLNVMAETGLGYLALGQRLDALSGGEGQRLKLAVELMKPVQGEGLFILDEPTAGLHHEDTTRLLAVFDRLLARGHTLIIVEHDLDVIAHSGWVIDLGPDGGAGGGQVVVCGPPMEIAAHRLSATGEALRRRLGRPPGH
jgi:excinuclease ABC subunit A